jgi:hypothetical protein
LETDALPVELVPSGVSSHVVGACLSMALSVGTDTKR